MFSRQEGERLDRNKRRLAESQKTVWLGEAAARHGGWDQHDKSRLQAVGQRSDGF